MLQLRQNAKIRTLMIKTVVLSLLSVFPLTGDARDIEGVLNLNEKGNTIPKEIYGQFAEHLGSCIYGGLWVGENSAIPNIKGYRTDVFQALKELHIPVLRWPGGCFADEYHWQDGIGPKELRPKMQNNNWGGTIEDNSFGTHEFLNLCEMLGCEPYISGNVGSGSVEELAKWVEYMTSEKDTPMARLRRKNGRDKAWKVKYLGIGNESWGCGGNMRPEYYADLYRRYAVYCRNYDSNRLFKIASGASDYDYNWTDVLMNRIGNRMNAVSLHYYTVKGWSGSKGSATQFSNDDYYWTIGKCLEIEDVIKRHSRIMDKKDPNKKIGLFVDEWGTWWDEEPGTIPGHLYQQNTMRDAFVAALTFNIFHKHSDRVWMANIAQVVNVLQSMILTDTIGKGHMVLTPTYHVFNMYKDFQNAKVLPLHLNCDSIVVKGDKKAVNGRKVPLVHYSAAVQFDGTILVSLSNISLKDAQSIAIKLDGERRIKNVKASILQAGNISDFNSFEKPNKIAPTPFAKATVKNNLLRVNIPPKSIIVLKLN